MCGIAGAINSNVYHIMKVQAHRGQDGDGATMVDTVAFGHNRLSVIDLSGQGAQPIKDERYVLTYNGEIYNYKEFYTGTGNDAHAILDSIQRIGITPTLTNLNGMFAFAVYDRLTKKIHLAVDRFAQKPLYYTLQGDVFAFASCPSALLHLKPKWKINQDALQSYWSLGSCMGTLCIWDGIHRVEGSSHVTFDMKTKSITTQRYWTPSFIENARATIEDLVIDAIDKVKLADVPVHILLSGGIDSTLVASRFQGGHAIHLESNETDYAQLVADKYNITLNTVNHMDEDINASLIDYSLKCGEPSMAGIIPYITAKGIAKHAKVAVTANGADELFFGYNRINQNVTQEHIDIIQRKGYAHPAPFMDIDPRLGSGRWYELQTYIQCDLNRTLDFAAMAHTVEVRAPFLDHRLVEAALSIPQELNGRKQILKNMLLKLGFDDAFVTRRKQGFSLHYTSAKTEANRTEALDWCVNNGFLTLHNPSPTDVSLLKYSAHSFYWFHRTFKSIIE